MNEKHIGDGHLDQRLRNRTAQAGYYLRGQHFAVCVECGLPDGHPKSDEGADDVDGSSAELQSKRYEEYTAYSQAGTISGEGVVQFCVRYAQLLVI